MESPAPDPDDVWPQIRSALERLQRPFPHAAVALALQHREAVAPHLLTALEDVARDPEAAVADGDYMLHLFAMVLLATWRDTRAYRPLLALARLPQETLDEVVGDSLHEMYGRAVASVCDGDMAPMRELIANESLSIWARMALLEGWKVRVMEGDADIAPLEDLMLDIGQRNVERLRRGEREQDGPEMIDSLVSEACDLGSQRLLGPAREWFAAGLIDKTMIDAPFFEREFARPHGDRVDEMRRRRNGYISDVAAEIAWWASYAEAPPPAPRAVLRNKPKIGRNDPCPCGSGRKYKKCHGAS